MSHLPFIANLLLAYFKTNTSQNETVSNVLWQAWQLMSGPNLATGAQLLSFNRTQSRVVN